MDPSHIRNTLMEMAIQTARTMRVSFHPVLKHLQPQYDQVAAGQQAYNKGTCMIPAPCYDHHLISLIPGSLLFLQD